MNEIDDIYNELIMEHGLCSCHKKNLCCPTCCMMGHNPNCGDRIELQLELKDNIIQDMSFTGEGCAISQGSTSIMIETLVGKTVEEARQIIGIFIKMIRREELTEEEKDMLGDSIAFENISNMPARVKCALLSWYTMKDMIEKKEQ